MSTRQQAIGSGDLIDITEYLNKSLKVDHAALTRSVFKHIEDGAELKSFLKEIVINLEKANPFASTVTFEYNFKVTGKETILIALNLETYVDEAGASVDKNKCITIMLG